MRQFREIAASKELAGTSRSSARTTRVETFLAPPSFAARAAIPSIAAEASVARTLPVAPPRFATRRATSPVPAPRSSTRDPSAILAADSSSSVVSAMARSRCAADACQLAAPSPVDHAPPLTQAMIRRAQTARQENRHPRDALQLSRRWGGAAPPHLCDDAAL